MSDRRIEKVIEMLRCMKCINSSLKQSKISINDIESDLKSPYEIIIKKMMDKENFNESFVCSRIKFT